MQVGQVRTEQGLPVSDGFHGGMKESSRGFSEVAAITSSRQEFGSVVNEETKKRVIRRRDDAAETCPGEALDSFSARLPPVPGREFCR